PEGCMNCKSVSNLLRAVHLKKLGFYKLKIDRSFVIDIGRDPDDEAIIRAIVQLAQTLGMQTLAEGVETWEQARFLAQAGCDHLQGWLVSPAVPADAFEAFVAAHDPRAFLERLGGPPPSDAGPR
ncbi:EAL domain-containing protein, partial [Tepidimonas sp.]|uniref:EAL domain-containing protein n=1 Tax=Tepidimonas sp. TaxID=2002775 RepID=UPI002FE1FC0C